MLTVSKMSNIDYYLTLAKEDYYVGQATALEPSGKWLGQGTAKAMLDTDATRQVDPKTFKHLFAGYNPDGGQKWVFNAGRFNGKKGDRMPGYDMTFSAPKSVSICWALAEDQTRQAIADAHQKAIEGVIAEIEKITIIRTGAGGRVRESAGIIAGVFQHATARQVDAATMPDMQLHSHCCVINTAITKNGRTGAINGLDFLNEDFAKQYGASYKARLANELIKVGFELERTKDGWEIKGVSQQLIEHFSKRSKQIEKEVDRETATAKEKTVANKKTRQSKQEYEPERLLSHWKEEAEEKHHFGAHSVEKLRGNFSQEQNGAKIRAGKSDGLTAAQKLSMIRGVAGELTKEKNTFTRRELENKGMISCIGMTPDDVRESVTIYLRTEAVRFKQEKVEKTIGTTVKSYVVNQYTTRDSKELAYLQAQKEQERKERRAAELRELATSEHHRGANTIIVSFGKKTAEEVGKETGLKSFTVAQMIGDSKAEARKAEREEKDTLQRRATALYKQAVGHWSSDQAKRHIGKPITDKKWMADFKFITRQISEAERNFIHWKIDEAKKDEERIERQINQGVTVIINTKKSDQPDIKRLCALIVERGGRYYFRDEIKGHLNTERHQFRMEEQQQDFERQRQQL